MNATIGDVTGQEIKKNWGDGSPVRRLIQTQISDDADVQTVELMLSPGEDSAPQNGQRMLIITISEAWKIGISLDDGITPRAAAGEKMSRPWNVEETAAWIIQF